MPDRDYYIVLGIPRDESEAGIRAAYRELAKRHHPDRAGPDGAPRFREVADAYAVLGDAAARRQYDEQLRRREAPGRGRRRARPAAPAPLVDEPLVCHVLLSREEARTGGVLPIRIPVLERCRSCGGSGHGWPFSCMNCNASGTIQRSATVEVRIPPGVASGTRFTAGLGRLGIANRHVEVLVRVAGGR